MGQKEWRMPKQPKPFRSRILILGLVSGVALLASIPAVLAKDRQPGIEENYDDPRAETIFAYREIRLLEGDGHIRLVD
jgi:hypothetical protein